MQKRDEYTKFVASGKASNPADLDDFFRNVYADRKLITEPLSPDQMEAADAWKVTYLRRLRTQKTDESYINAYMKAWNLDPKDVFSGQ